MKIHHLGNTANNAVHNVLLMDSYTKWESVLPIQMFGLNHAISAPAWELSDFSVPNSSWVENPNWDSFTSASKVNNLFSDLPPSIKENIKPTSISGQNSETKSSITLKQLIGRSIAASPFHQDFNNLLVKRARNISIPTSIGLDEICILYGADSLLKTKPPKQSRQVVSLEHGTIRWVADGAKADSEWRKLYSKQVKQTRHLWVTNLDPRTLEIAEDLMPGRWSALPHPFMYSDDLPFQQTIQIRNRMLEETKSEFLILLPSSQNWAKHHDKGSIKALTAFVHLRKQGIDAGLVAAEWGLQLEESKEYLEKSGVSEHVKWVSPMSRFKLQQMMANVDVVWDQFGLDAFGALALRALEQGAPLISRGLKPEGVNLIGTQVPWMIAENSEQISEQTKLHFGEIGLRGREEVCLKISNKYRSWLRKHHSPEITANLQDSLYSSLVGNNSKLETSINAWAKYSTNFG